MKGFKKDGKFRPTEKRNKSSLKKSDVVRYKKSKEDIAYELKEKKENIARIKHIEELTKKIEKHWTSEGEVPTIEKDDGVNFWHVFTSKEDPELTYEIHWMEDEVEADPPEHPEMQVYNSWYWFDARNGKGIPNSPSVQSETGGYTIQESYEQYLEDILSDYPTGVA
jgi:hypothetical protein